MPIELRWMASLPASALAAAEAISDGLTLADPKLAAALEQPARKLIANIRRFTQQPGGPNSTSSTRGFKPALPPTAILSPEKLLQHLIPLSVENTRLLQLAEVALMKVADRPIAHENAPRLAELLRQVITAFQSAVPGVVDQLTMRGQPLQQQWEARGPGLVAALGRLLDPELIPAQATVILIHPLEGGGGSPYIPYNSVRLEAVLADPVPGLPEVLRLAWLVAQLNCDLAKFQGEMTRQELASAAALAMIPAVLAAAEELELARCDEATIKLALRSWRVRREEAKQDSNSESATALQNWWETYLNSRPPWHVALAAISQMHLPK